MNEENQAYSLNSDNEVEVRELTFGERAVGLTFNPSNDPDVQKCKTDFARMIDNLDNLRRLTRSQDVARMCGIAITELQTAQMWAVKAIKAQW